jgi:hypothetical protein
MPAECSAERFDFGRVEGRIVEATFDAGLVTSDAGALLLGATDRAIDLVGRFADCFRDYRRQELIEHAVGTLVGQRVFGIALGYEDLNDHDELRHDPLMAVLSGKLAARRQDCAPVAGKSTLNRLELSRNEPSRYHKIAYDTAAIEALPVRLFLEAHKRPPEQIILDLDATDDPLHGHQEGRFFHGYYDCYCYLPLYVFCGRHLLAAKLRPSDIDASAGSVEEVERIVRQIRARWPFVRIVLRADSGFAREALMAWCEQNRVDYVFGLARNVRLVAMTEEELAAARAAAEKSGHPARRFKDFQWTTLDSWSRRRRVVAKAEWTKGEANPRFVVTSLKRSEAGARQLYENIYCARGDMENRIKECQLDLYADRTSARTMRANQLRLWFAAMAYVLICAVRRIGLAETTFADATCGTIRLKFLKIGALVCISCRRIKIAMASACPTAQDWGRAARRLGEAANARASPA